MGFVINDFGTLKNVTKNDRVVEITNTNNQSLIMSRSKFKESADRVYSIAQSLIGKEVRVQTSQNTANWSASEWFSDIFEKL
jgi:hypothetical protein